MPQTVLVTGAAGFIGSHLCDEPLQRDYRVIGVDDLSMGSLDNLRLAIPNPNFNFVKLDVLKREELLALGRGVEIVVHLAAFKIPRYSNALQTLRINGLGAFSVFDLAAENRAKLVLASTSDVYGKNKDLPFNETSSSVLGPSNVPRWSYAVSKLFEEQLLFAYSSEHKFPVSIARFFGCYGPRQHLSWWGGPQSCFISAILKDQQVEIHGGGLQTRTFCYVEDLVDGIIRMIENPAANGEIVNLGGTQEISIIDLATLIQKLVHSGKPLNHKIIPYSSFGNYEDVIRRVPDIEKAKRILGFIPKVDLETGLRRTIDWQRPLVS